MSSSYSALLNRLEAAVDAIYELAERYALYKTHHAWSHAYEACSVWKKAVEIAIDTVESLEALDVCPSEEDIERLSKTLFYVRELGKITEAILAERQALVHGRQ